MNTPFVLETPIQLDQAAMAKPILNELKFFVNCVSANHRKLPADVSAQLVRCSLHLLEHLPAAREAVLEYFATVFDVSVGNYIQFIDKEPNGTASEDETIADIQDALENLVTDGPPAWAPLISSWSLRILGALSNKFSGGRSMDIGSSCTRWLGSNAMRCLLGLAASCFGKLNSTETEDCITTLLSTYVQNSPHFDWVVARLGGCFPLKVISKILQCGLKGFVGNYNNTLDSEVGILAYLSFAHESDLIFALKEMLEAGLNKNSSSVQPNTVPYLMHLSSMSEILLQPILKVFLDIFNDSLIPILVSQSKQWPTNFNPRDIQPTLATLSLKLKANATQTVLTLARIAEKYPWCQEFLENIIQELESVVLSQATCPLLSDLMKDESVSPLWASCCSSNSIEQQTAVRLLLLASSQSPYIYNQTVAELLTHCYASNTNGLAALVRILAAPMNNMDAQQIKPAFELALDGLLWRSAGKSVDDLKLDINVLTNLKTLIVLEQKRSTPYLERLDVCLTVGSCVERIIDIWSGYIQKEMRFVETSEVTSSGDVEEHSVKRIKLASSDHWMDQVNNVQTDQYTEQIHIIAEILDTIEFGTSQMKFGSVIRLSKLTTKYFFWSLIEKNATVRLTTTHRAYRMMGRLCAAQKGARTIALRELLDGALFIYGNLFGAQSETDYMDNVSKRREGELLLKQNQKQGNAIRSILHARPIGQGPKVQAKESSLPDPELQSAFLDAISACCTSTDKAQTTDGFSTVSLLLVELVSSDVMYNGLTWPEEDLINKVTMERDLQIRRTFRNAPILWAILGMVAAHRPAICYSSVLLRAICASVLHQWRAKSVDKFQLTANNTDLLDVTYKMLEIMAMGQLLPPPLDGMHAVIEHLDPTEISTVLKECVWNYMRDNPATGIHWRQAANSRPAVQYLDPLRNIMQCKLPILGAFYHHMFVMPELTENVASKTTIQPIATTSI